MLIDIVGWHGKHNAGDEAFRLAFETFFAGHRLNFLTPPVMANQGDMVVLGAGSVVSPFYLESIPNDNRPLYALGIGIAYESEIDLLATRNFKHIMVRNDTDVAAMQKKLPNCIVQGIPDIAFLHRCTPNIARKPKTAVVLATDYVNPAIDRPVEKFAARAFSFQKKMAEVCDTLLDQGWEVTLLPCSTGGYGDDRRMALDIMAFMKHPYDSVTNIMETMTPEKMIEIIAAHEFSISMRFHAHIFSIIAGTPFVSIGATRKVDLFLAENNLKETRAGWFDGDEFHYLMPTINKVIENGDQYRERFAKIADTNFNKMVSIGHTIQQCWH
jgi:polysaccharide pyruvyl transferase WcaK-like protein